MRPHDIETLTALSRPTIAPDGSFAVWATSSPSLDADRYIGRLWRAELRGGAPRPLTRGVADASPLISPDGHSVAFVREDADGARQLFVVESSGGEPVQASDQLLGVREFVWSPDGRRLAFTAPVPETGRYARTAGRDASAESPRRVTGVAWNANGVGYTIDRPVQLFVVDAPDLSAEPIVASAPGAHDDERDGLRVPRIRAIARQLTDGPHSHASPVFTSDGAAVLVVTSDLIQGRADLRTRVESVPIEAASTPVTVVDTLHNLAITDIAVAPDGSIALLAADVGESGTDFIAPGVGIRVNRGGVWRPLTDPDDVDLGEVGSRITALDDGSFLAQRRTRGRVQLIRVSHEGGIVVLRDGGEVTGHAATADGSLIVVAVADERSLGEMEVIDADGLHRLTALGATPDVVVPVEREIVARDGYPVHGWLAVPPGDGPFPVILQIHGGPFAQYGVHLFDETQILIAAGYAVVYCNPRGSAGYGRAHGRAVRHRMGTVDHVDVTDFLDAVIADDPRLDGERLGIMGGSYGGYLTAWTIAHDHRFTAAIVERGFLDPASFAGTSDIGSYFGWEYMGSAPELVTSQSAMAVVGEVTTPTLVIHSEQDLRCPLEQGTRYYAALRRNGVEAEMLIFPGEDHELTRSGRPRHRIERFEAVLEWWARWLPTGTAHA